MPVRWMEYEGKKILYADFRRLSPSQILRQMKESDDMVRAAATKVLCLGNIEDAVVSGDVMGHLRQYADKTVRRKFERLAVVGAVGAKKVSLKAFVGMVDRSTV